VEPLEARNLLAQGLVFVPSPPVVNGALSGAAAIAGNDIWAVGGGTDSSGVGTTLAEHFNGTSWSVVSTPSISGADFSSVAAAASNDVWAVGSQPNSQPLIERWDGTNWSVVSSPSPGVEADLTGVTAVSSNDVWAVGSNSGNALVEHWDGKSWSIVSSPAFSGVGGLNAISADASNDVWAVGCCGPVGTPPAILHWNGTSWTLVANRPDLQAEGVTALSPTDVWGAGLTFTTGSHQKTIASVEHWDGTSWSIVPSPNPNVKNPTVGSRLNGIAAISANDIWAVGFNDAATLTEHWDGTSWKIVNSPNPGDLENRFSGVTALGDGTVAAVGFQDSSATGLTPLILQNVASAPRTPTAGSTTTTQALLDAAPVDQFLGAIGPVDSPLWSTGHVARAHRVATSGDRDVLPGASN
jgi:hypothetical protein